MVACTRCTGISGRSMPRYDLGKTMADLERLDWDSEYFGLEIYQTSMLGRLTHNAAKEAGVELLLWRGLPLPLTFATLVDAGWQMADDMVTMRMPLRRTGSKPVWTEPMPSDDPFARYLVSHFPLSRFETIPLLRDNGGSAGVYRHYLQNNLMALNAGGHLKGLTAWRAIGKEAFLDLIVADERDRGHGIGTMLIDDVLDAMALEGCEWAETTTWLTEPAALALYRKAGFKAVSRLQTWWVAL